MFAPDDTEFCDDLPPESAAILEGVDPGVRPSGTYADTMGPFEPIAPSTGTRSEMREEMTGLLIDAITDWASCE